MNKVLLISEKQIKAQSIIEQNVDSKILSKVIFNVQETKLRAILGADLYATVLAIVAAKVKDGVPVDEPYLTLIDSYIQPYLVQAALVDFIVVNNYKVTNKGTLKLRDDVAANVSPDELEYAKNYYDNYAATYKQQLIDFLIQSKLKSPGTDTDTTTDSIGWFLGGGVVASSVPVGDVKEPSFFDQTLYYTRDEVDSLVGNVTVGSASWNTITDKPSAFNPSAHTHSISDIDALQTTLNAKANTVHTHVVANITGLQTALDAKLTTPANPAEGKVIKYVSGSIVWSDDLQASGGSSSVDWTSVTNKPSTFAPSAHTHAISEVTGLQTALDGKQAAGSYAASNHTHAIANVTGLQAALDAKQVAGSYASSTHTHAIADTTGLQAALDSKQAAGAYAPTVHAHEIADVNGLSNALSGKVAASHTHSIADTTGLQDALDAKQAAGSYAAATHVHSGSDITSGTIDPARLGSGTTDATTVLYGDGSWKTAPTGGGGSSANPANSFQFAFDVLNPQTGKGHTLGIAPHQLTNNTALAINVVHYVPVFIPKAATISGVSFMLSTVGNFTVQAVHNNAIGLYSVTVGTGAPELTLIASKSYDDTIWKGTTNVWKNVAFTSSVSVAAGLYYLGFCYMADTATTAPRLYTIAAYTPNTLVPWELTSSNGTAYSLSGSRQLPSPYTLQSTVALNTMQYAPIYTYFRLY